ncbi:MAG: hypothetical protein HYU57_05225 [Micavibrio aeruginosavorus]|nr:hypothetical protein [Micavibrio aeruginosavorus]
MTPRGHLAGGVFRDSVKGAAQQALLDFHRRSYSLFADHALSLSSILVFFN